MFTEQQIKTAAKLYDMRDTAKSLLGVNYKPRMDEIGKILTQKSQIDKTEIIRAATQLCNEYQFSGMNVIVVMAAAVELIEPSKVPA